ncbi:MAG: hypothetical protein JSU92_10075 [Deltaproteobacteria bacterium]|nr:MAG: hypothetical protein JSU92_10075 [Deltaproteobacteria bacterium]
MKVSVKLLNFLLLGVLIISCSKQEQATEPPTQEGITEKESNIEIRDIKPVILDLPQTVKTKLKGKVEDKVYIYFDSLNIIVFIDEWDVKANIKLMAESFAELTKFPEFEASAKFWTIQIQPPYEQQRPEVMVFSTIPEQANEYVRSGDLKRLLRSSSYMNLNDRILEPEERIALLE